MVKVNLGANEGLEISYESVCFYVKALAERIEQNHEELDEKNTKMLYSRVISELETYEEAMDKDFFVELEDDDYKFFAENPPLTKKLVAALESFWGPVHAQKARKWAITMLLRHYRARYEAITP